jgi:hypothetical protein
VGILTPGVDSFSVPSHAFHRQGMERFMTLKASVEGAQLQPIPAPQLEIASLARGLGTAPSDDRAAHAGPVRLSIGLHKESLGSWKSGGYFTLKMLMVRALRRSLKSAVIEVDDAGGTAPADTPFEISLQPADPDALLRAQKVVKRVIRSRRWRMG